MSCPRCPRAAGWIAPTMVLVLMPKCPACVVGYVAMLTGVGISFTVAAWLRTILLVAALAMLAWLGLRWLLRKTPLVHPAASQLTVRP